MSCSKMKIQFTKPELTAFKEYIWYMLDQSPESFKDCFGETEHDDRMEDLIRGYQKLDKAFSTDCACRCKKDTGEPVS